MVTTERTSFKGNPCITISYGNSDKGEAYQLTFGYQKAKAIVDAFEDIELFCIDVEQDRSKQRKKY